MNYNCFIKTFLLYVNRFVIEFNNYESEILVK